MKNKPLYKQLMNQLKQEIKDKKYQPGDKLPTELELSTKYEVSRITAKRALTELENEGLIIRRRGSGSFLAEKVSPKNITIQKKILFLAPFLDDQGFGDYSLGISKVFEDKNYTLFIQPVNEFETMDSTTIQNQYDGLIFYPLTNTHFMDIIYELFLDDFPVVFLDKYLDGLAYPSVTADNLDGSCRATDYLIQNGHKNILFLYHHLSANTVQDRYLGYIKSLHYHQIKKKFLFKRIEEDADNLKELVQLLKEKHITAIIAENDILAIQTIQKLRSLQIEVPKDLSVIGFDNISASQLLSPSLTTIAQPFSRMGELAAELIIKQIEKQKTIHEQLSLPVEFIIRESTQKIKRKEESLP